MNWNSVYDHVHRDPSYRAEAELVECPECGRNLREPGQPMCLPCRREDEAFPTRSADDEAAIEALRQRLTDDAYYSAAQARVLYRVARKMYAPAPEVVYSIEDMTRELHDARRQERRACIAMALALLL
jgi:hypothetical protein